MQSSTGDISTVEGQEHFDSSQTLTVDSSDLSIHSLHSDSRTSNMSSSLNNSNLNSLEAIKADRVQLLHRIQGLQIAMDTNRAETDMVFRRNKELQESLARCRERVSELETQVLDGNRKLAEQQEVERNYDAALGRVGRLETENRVLQEDRTKYLEEATAYCQQSSNLTRQNDLLRDRLDDQNRALKILGDERREKDDEIKRLRDQLQNNRNPAFRQDDSVQPLRPKKCFKVESVVLDQQEDDSRSYSEFTDSLYTTASTRKRGRFSMEPSAIPICRNCMTVFGVTSNQQSPCRFHRLEPQSFSGWKHILGRSRYQGLNVAGLKYWACCDVLGHREPPGCMVLRRHEIQYPSL